MKNLTLTRSFESSSCSYSSPSSSGPARNFSLISEKSGLLKTQGRSKSQNKKNRAGSRVANPDHVRPDPDPTSKLEKDKKNPHY
jgi:hypothetical protein